VAEDIPDHIASIFLAFWRVAQECRRP